MTWTWQQFSVGNWATKAIDIWRRYVMIRVFHMLSTFHENTIGGQFYGIFVNSGFKIQESCQCPLAKSYKPLPGQLQLGGRGQRRMAISGAWKNQNHGNNSEDQKIIPSKI